MMRAILAIAISGALVASAGPSQAQNCGPRDQIAGRLFEGYNEFPAERGIVADGSHYVELYRTEDGSTWTLLITNSRGVSCLMAVGSGWESITQKPGQPL